MIKLKSRVKYQYSVDVDSQEQEAKEILENAMNFVSRLKEIDKTVSKELVLKRLDKKS